MHVWCGAQVTTASAHLNSFVVKALEILVTRISIAPIEKKQGRNFFDTSTVNPATCFFLVLCSESEIFGACFGVSDDLSLLGGSTILLLILQPSLQQWKLHQAGVVFKLPDVSM